MKKLASLLFLLHTALVSVCQDFIGQYKDQINREIEKITKQADTLRYQTAGRGQHILEIYNSENPTIKKAAIPADTMSFALGKNSEIKIDCYFRPKKSTCDSLVILCFKDNEGKILIKHLIEDSYRNWKSMSNSEYLSLQLLGEGATRSYSYVTTAKMLIEYPDEENIYARVTIVKTQVAEKEWKKLQQKK